MAAAFEGYTATPARLGFMEGRKGKIKEAAKADFILLKDYPDETANENIKDIRVQQTWMDGKKNFDAEERQN